MRGVLEHGFNGLNRFSRIQTLPNYELRITNYELRITRYELRDTNYLRMKNKFICLAALGFYFSFCFGFSSCANTANYGEGKELYEENCANCHIEDGTGVGELIPPLAKSDYLKKTDLDIACIIRYGLKGKITVNGINYEHEMPPHTKLSEVEITNIANYVHNAWGNQRAFISLEQIKEKLKSCAGKSSK